MAGSLKKISVLFKATPDNSMVPLTRMNCSIPSAESSLVGGMVKEAAIEGGKIGLSRKVWEKKTRISQGLDNTWRRTLFTANKTTYGSVRVIEGDEIGSDTGAVGGDTKGADGEATGRLVVVGGSKVSA